MRKKSQLLQATENVGNSQRSADEYESNGTKNSDRVCKKLSVCDNTEFQSKAPTKKTDRECRKLTTQCR